MTACLDLMWGVYLLAVLGAVVVVAVVVMTVQQARKKGD